MPEESHPGLTRLLRLAERYTKTDLTYLIGNGLWLTVTQVGIALIAFGVSIAFAHFVSKEVYGTYRFLLSIFWTLAAFSLTGLPTVLSRAVARHEEGAYRQSVRITFLGALPMSLIAAGIAIYYWWAGNATLADGAVVIAVVAPFFQVGYLYPAFLEGKRDFKNNTTFGILLNLVPALGLLVAMLLNASAVILLFTYLGLSALTALGLFVATERVHKPNNVKSPELVKLSWHFSAMNILSTIATQLDQLLVFHFLGPISLALYSFATSLPDQIKNVFGLVSNLAFPKYVERTITEIQSMMSHRILTMTIALIVALGAYIAVTPFLFHLLYPAYGAAVVYSQLYALTLLPSSSMIPLTVLQAHAAKRELYIYNIGTAVVQIATLVVGIIMYGLLGLIIARAVGRIFNLVLGLVLTRMYEKRMTTSF